MRGNVGYLYILKLAPLKPYMACANFIKLEYTLSNKPGLFNWLVLKWFRYG